MNPSTIRSKLNELGVKAAQYEFGWSHCTPVMIIGNITVFLPINDSQDRAFAEFVADIVNNPSKYTSTMDTIRMA